MAVLRQAMWVVIVLLVMVGVVFVAATLPWLIAAALAWLGVVAVRRVRRRDWASAVAAPTDVRPAMPSRQRFLERRYVDAGRLPRAPRAQAEQIRQKARWLLQHEDLFPAGSQERYLVEKTLNDYLPSTIAAYLAVPAAYAERPSEPGGRSAVQELKCQLDILEAKLDDLGTVVHRNSVDRLRANGRFLEERFKPQGSELDLPVDPARA